MAIYIRRRVRQAKSEGDIDALELPDELMTKKKISAKTQHLSKSTANRLALECREDTTAVRTYSSFNELFGINKYGAPV